MIWHFTQFRRSLANANLVFAPPSEESYDPHDKGSASSESSALEHGVVYFAAASIDSVCLRVSPTTDKYCSRCRMEYSAHACFVMIVHVFQRGSYWSRMHIFAIKQK